MLSRHCRSGFYIFWKSSSKIFFSTDRVSQNILNFFLVIFLFCGRVAFMLLNAILKSAKSFWWLFAKYSKLFQRISHDVNFWHFPTFTKYEIDWHSSCKLQGELSLAEEVHILYLVQTCLLLHPLSEICNLWYRKETFQKLWKCYCIILRQLYDHSQYIQIAFLSAFLQIHIAEWFPATQCLQNL